MGLKVGKSSPAPSGPSSVPLAKPRAVPPIGETGRVARKKLGSRACAVSAPRETVASASAVCLKLTDSGNNHIESARPVANRKGQAHSHTRKCPPPPLPVRLSAWSGHSWNNFIHCYCCSHDHCCRRWPLDLKARLLDPPPPPAATATCWPLLIFLPRLFAPLKAPTGDDADGPQQRTSSPS